MSLPALELPIPADQVFRAALSRDINALIEFTFGVVRPGAMFRPNWHLDAIAHKLARIESGSLKRLIITVPPRNLKSVSASVALPAWFLGRHPHDRVVAVSYSDTLARLHANDFRLVVNHPAYKDASQACGSPAIPTARSRPLSVAAASQPPSTGRSPASVAISSSSTTDQAG